MVEAIASRRRALGTAVIAASCLIIAAAFSFGVVLPLRTGMITLIACTAAAVPAVRIGGISFLTRFAVLAYVLPFSMMLGYLVTPNFKWWPTPEAMRLMEDHVLLREMVAVGTVGLLALMFGMRLSHRALPGSVPPAPARAANMTLPLYAAVLALALLLSWLSAPRQTVLTGAYGDIIAHTVANDLAFHSAYFISYVIFVLAFLDAERTGAPQMRRAKLVSLALVVAYVVVVLQLLRGDRESSGALVALAGLYLTSPIAAPSWREMITEQRVRLRRLMVPTLILVLTFAAVGALRNSIAGARRGTLTIDPVLTLIGLQSSWTAVLLTNLAIGAEYRRGDMRLLYGQTYVDYALSLPPSLVTNALGIERAVEPTKGPSWWSLGIGIGGIHIALVPFKNFGIFGVFVLLAAFGYLIGAAERANLRGGFGPRMCYGTMLCVILFWFWYGDMYVIRAFMIAALVALPYHTMTRVLHRGAAARVPASV